MIKYCVSPVFLQTMHYLYIVTKKDMAARYKEKTNEELKALVDESNTFGDLMKKLGYNTNRGGTVTLLRRYLKENNIDFSKFSKRNIHNFSHPKKKLEDVLVEDSDYTNLNSLKKRLLNEGLIEYKCEECGISEWKGKHLVLQLDHINGNNRDNRLENLRLLCPNCHSQTDTFSRKKTRLKKKKVCENYRKKLIGNGEHEMCQRCAHKSARKVDRPEKEELVNLLKKYGFVSVGKMFGVSDNAVRKWCVSYGLPKSIKFYK